jgi:hypothetical protein
MWQEEISTILGPTDIGRLHTTFSSLGDPATGGCALLILVMIKKTNDRNITYRTLQISSVIKQKSI